MGHPIFLSIYDAALKSAASLKSERLNNCVLFIKKKGCEFVFIKRLKLVNFIGIKSGTGQDEIEIFFPKNNKPITMLAGGNGSGKSTILSMLTPFKESFDDRKNLILDGKEGIKEIDIEHDGHEYKIKHVYGKTTSSFISEDGIELNENGGVRTCKEIIMQKLKVNDDYFKIAKIGSNLDTFINFTTSQRKLYISSFVEAVQKYLDAFDIVNKKAKDNDNQIKQISEDLKKMDDSATLAQKISENEATLAALDDEILKSNQEVAKLDVQIENLSKTMSGINYLSQKELLKLKEDSLKKNNIINEKFNRLYSKVTIDDCDKTITELESDLTDLKTKLSVSETSVESLTKQITSCDNDILKMKNQLIGKKAINLQNIQVQIDSLKAKKSDLRKKINGTGVSIASIIESEINTASGYLSSFKNLFNTLFAYYVELNDDSLIQGTPNINIFFKPDFSSVFNTQANNTKSILSGLRDKLEKKNNEYSTKTANIKKLDILNKRPLACKIDDCPFIADALKYSNLPEEMASLEKEIETIKKSISNDETRIEKLSDIQVMYSDISKVFLAINSSSNFIYQEFRTRYGKISEFMKKPINDAKSIYSKYVEEIEDDILTINSLNETDSMLKEYTSQLTTGIEFEKTRLYFENMISATSEKKLTLENEKQELISSKNKLADEISGKTEKLNDFKDYKNSLVDADNLEKDVSDIQNTLSVYETASKEKNTKISEKSEITSKINKLKADRDIVTNNITQFKATEITISKLSENLKQIEKDFNKISLVKKALDPKSGIPLVFIKSYLGGTELITNELLNIAYNGKFEIKFVPSAKDFMIQVRSGDNIIEDIKLASQGEISMTTISISLALIERSLGEYNIMYLDEIDGPLDKNNRESFINILNKQIQKLGIEQIFIISHNNAFENCSMNLILLSGNSVDKDNEMFMANKEILFEVQ